MLLTNYYGEIMTSKVIVIGSGASELHTSDL